MSDALRAAFQAYAALHLPAWASPAVGPLVPLTDGWESELYAFELVHGPAAARRRHGLVLRLYPGEGADTKAAHEFDGMRRLHAAGYPVPAVHHLEPSAIPLGKPFILMDRIVGKPLWTLLDKRPPPEQAAALEQFCHLFVRLHRLEWQPFVADPARLSAAGPFAFVDAMLTDARQFLQRASLPGFAPVVAWLSAHRDAAACPRPAVTHRDFHPANLLVRADGRAFVIDWPNWQVTDPRFDLAWTLVLCQAYAGPALRNAVLAGYEQASGSAVEHLAYFEAHACARRLADVAVSLAHGAERLGMRPEAVALMRSQRGATLAVADLLEARTGVRVTVEA